MSTRTLFVRWTLAGLSLGLVFPIVAWVVVHVTASEPLGIWETHADQPVIYVAYVAPLLLGALGAVIGIAHGQISKLQAQTAEMAERVARELDAELHDTNVELARTASLQTKYFAALSHDMRTPLSAIIGFSSLASDDEYRPDTDAVLAYMEEIGKCAGQLLEIVNDLLDAAKLESGRIEVQIGDVEGDDVAAQVIEHLRPLADEKGLALEIDLGVAPTPVRADPLRLRQILTNLVSNAIKYTDEGSVTLRSFTAGGRVFYEVSDSGHGISEEDMPKVFTPFEQTDVAKARLDSTGLGLPISLGLAKAMHGTIEAESPGEGQGSTFRVVLLAGPGKGTELTMAALPSFEEATAAA